VGSRGRPGGAAGHSTPRLYACAVLAFPPAPHVMLALYNYTGVSCFTARRAPRKRCGSAGALSSPGQAQPSAHGGAGKPFTALRRPAATAGMHRVVLRRSGAHRGPGLDGHRAGRQKALPVHAGRDTHEQPRAAGAALRQRGADAAKASRPCACASARACLRSGTAARCSPGPALLSRSNSAAHGTVRGDMGAAAAACRGGSIEQQRCAAALCSILIYALAHSGNLCQPSGEPSPPAAASTYKTAGAASACAAGGGQRCTHGAAASQRSRRCRVTTWPAVGRKVPACCCAALRTVVHARDGGLLCVALVVGNCQSMRLTIMLHKDGSGSVQLAVFWQQRLRMDGRGADNDGSRLSVSE